MEERQHTVALDNRKSLEILGVIEVESTTEQKIILKTIMGDMVILGEALFICHLDLEAQKASFGGKINSLSYPDKVLRGKGKVKATKGKSAIFR